MGFWGMVYYLALFAGSMAIALLTKPKSRSRQDALSSWGNQETLQESGIPIDLHYGKVPVKGNIFSQHTEIVNYEEDLNDLFLNLVALFTKGYFPENRVTSSYEKLNTRIGFGDGPVVGLDSDYSVLNDQKIADLTGVTTNERLGTDIQTATGLADLAQFPHEEKVAVGSPVTIQMQDADYDDLAIILTSQEGLRRLTKDGKPMAEKLGCKLEIRIIDKAWHTLFDGWLVAETANPVYWRGVASGSYPNGTPFTVVKGDRHEWKVTCDYRSSAANSQGTLFTWATQQIYSSVYKFPGLSFLEVRALPSDKLNSGLRFSGVLQGKIVEDVETGALAWSDSPADVIRDLLCRPCISGDGGGTPYSVDYYRGLDPSTLNTTDFTALKDWCAELVDDGNGGTEKRFRFNGSLSGQGERWEQAAKVAAMCRATLWYDGINVRVWIDKAATASHLFCTANMSVSADMVSAEVPNTAYREWSTDPRQIPSSIESTIFNEDANYAETPLKKDDPLATHYHTESMEGFGIPRVSQFVRLADFVFTRNRNVVLKCEFPTDVNGMDAKPGDVVYVQYDGNNRGTGGWVVSAAGDTVVIDKPVTMAPATTYKLIVQTVTATGKHVNAYTVSTLTGSYTVTLTTSLTYTPGAGDCYLFAKESELDLYRVTAVKMAMDGRCLISAEQYKDEAYDLDDGTPDYDANIYIGAALGGRRSWRAISRDDLASVYNETVVYDHDFSSQVIGGGIVFSRNATTGVVTWTCTGEDGYGWLRYEGQSYYIRPDAVGTSDRFIYFDPNAIDSGDDASYLKSTNSVADLAGQERFLGYINYKASSGPKPWLRVGVDGQIITIDEVPMGALYRKELEETFEDTIDDFALRWAIGTPAISDEISMVAGGMHGGQCLEVGDNSGNDAGWFIFGKSVPFNPNVPYRLSVALNRTEGTQTFSAGVIGRNAADDGYVDYQGNDTILVGNHYNCAASSKAPTGDDAWYIYEGFFQGTAATGDTGEKSDPTDPAKLHTNVKYIRPFFYVNRGGGAGIYQVDDVVLEIFPSVTSGGTGANTAAGARGNLGVKNIALLADAPTAKTSDYPIVVGDNGKHFTNTGASGTVVFTLPAATAGLVFAFTRVASQALKVAPASGEQYRGKAVNSYPELDSDATTLWIRCITTGVWDIMSLYGSVYWW